MSRWPNPWKREYVRRTVVFRHRKSGKMSVRVVCAEHLWPCLPSSDFYPSRNPMPTLGWNLFTSRQKRNTSPCCDIGSAVSEAG